MEDYDVEAIAWKNAQTEDLWIFDKLIVSKKLGYTCGPAGTVVPKPDSYIIRPCVNIPGMGRGAYIQHIENLTEHLPLGFFWCEVFNGRHISVDYRNGEQVLAVEGFRETEQLWRFSKWQKVDDIIPMPSIFSSLISKYEYINIEYIDGKAIEIHLRKNPDFVFGNSVAYPIWKYEPEVLPEGFENLKYVDSPDFNRKGFYID